MKVQRMISAQAPPAIEQSLLNQWAIQDHKKLRQAVQKHNPPKAPSQHLQEEMADPFYAADNEIFMGNDYY